MKGLSGSPIVTEKEQGIVVVGIHTHQGQKAGYNSGLYFNKAILETIFRVNKKAI
jgi:V8-like Glu-specific endopeptidase